MSKVDVKVVLLGKHDIGKTCLVERYLHGKFKSNVTNTVGAAFGAKKVISDNNSLTLGIWDTAGSERYESMSRIYYRAARAALVCYDVTSQSSFEKVRFWVEELMQNEDGCQIYIVATKVDKLDDGDLEAVDPKEVTQYAESISAYVYRTSAKTGEGVERLFQAVADNYLQKTENPALYNPDTVPVGNSDGGDDGGGNPCVCG
eukprot:CAMPEP_0119136840 /NCGR_PEP_ID=MMETSP1310-20130426/22237_1 /TAXON_ID=464262 /ORGANISM="Genus nov. species nov., Strain RCC2339" /LENGTH=202 /DNA_ID=CAMNT_0007127869 /DNA_START=113 /DNA_END=721 /DNA_ORIENTATION=-